MADKTINNSSEDYAIEVNDVSMIFNMASERLDNHKEYFIKLAKRELFFEEFRALDHVSFKVRRGEVLGLVGTNGSGKSTMLKIIAGVLEPSEGSVHVHGNIAPLIELGAGFDIELTARENIYLNGALLGYTKEFIDTHIDEIVEFAELKDFMDMPLKNYSSGMVARIAFAIATVVEPDVLIVDETLSVGDVFFQEKCERRIRDFIEALPTRPPVMALTATATRQVREDIEGTLGLHDPLRVVASFDRPNLSFSVERPANRRAKDESLLAFVREREGKSGIVYCMSRRAVEDVCDMLCENGIAATRYHAGLPAEERERNQADFIYDRAPVMVATNAFGMGIDKSNVSYVAHYNLPLSLENYYQEAGRAGRDGTRAECLLLYSPGDVHTAEFLLSRTERTDLTPEQLQAMREADEQRLRQMVFYATTTDCLRSFILRYFGEEAPAYCGNCGNCLADYEEVDERTNALKVLSCVARVRQHALACGSPATSVGAGSIVDILRGSRAQRVLERGWDELSTYGIMADVPVPRIRALIDELVYREFLTRTQGDYPTLALAGRGVVFMKGDKPFIMRVAKGRPKAPRRERRSRGMTGEDMPDLTPEQAELFERLRTLRTELAREQQVPPYLIFNNATLEDMCRKRPATREELLEVSGVGAKKAERYGEAFLQLIAGEG